MKNQTRATDEIPTTQEGLGIYIREMEKVFEPISKQYHKMHDLLQEAKLRMSRMSPLRKY